MAGILEIISGRFFPVGIKNSWLSTVEELQGEFLDSPRETGIKLPSLST